jgi:aspartyl-tRNA(Asn)/glutamyl-tRNA(Gln) amidotransferase subunit A
MCAAAIGTQTGGSIVRPAAYCGVVGFKPTIYAVSLEGVVPISPNLDHAGPIARRVSDVAAVYQVLQRLNTPRGSDSRPRLSWLKGYFWERADDEVRRVTEQAVRKLGDLVDDLDWHGMPDSFSDVPAAHRCLMAVDAAEYHRASFHEHRAHYGPRIASLIEEGLGVAAVDYARALRIQKQFAKEFQNALGTMLLLTPATTTPAPGRDTTGDPAFNSPWSFAGVPTVTLPCGLSSDGLPCGLQLISAKLDEQSLLAIASKCEERLRFAKMPEMSVVSCP